MPKKINIRKRDPEHYARIKAEQDELEKECSRKLKIERMCPYCNFPVSTVIRGNHGYAREVCPRCEEPVLFPPLSFRIAN